MRHVLYVAILFVLSGIVITSSPVHAQTPCGNIIAPEYWGDIGSSLTTTPITDCADPFGVTQGMTSPYSLRINNGVVGEGSAIEIGEGGISSYEIVGNPSLTSVNHLLFLHDGDDYRFIDMNPSEPKESDYQTLAEAFFPEGTDVSPYVQASIDGDYYFELDPDMQSVFWEFSDYVEQQFIPQLPQLAMGTYTLVSREYELMQVEASFLRKLFASIIPIAYAQSFPEYVYTLTFTVTEPVEEPTGASSILFLPGIMGSRLYTKDGGGDEDGLWEPNGNQDIRQLAMTEAGESIESIYTRDVIDAAYGVKDMYNKFSTFLDGLVGEKIIKDWEPFAYDWRYGVVDIANEGTQYEDAIHNAIEEIEILVEKSFSKKVTIVAHSNGGLLAKALLTRLEQEGKSALIDRVIFLASPELGTPKAIGVLLHGYDQQQGFGLLMDDAEIRAVAKNMSGVYGLLPSKKYFEKSGSVPITFGDGVSMQAFRTAYGSTIDDSAELTEFMVGNDDGRVEATEIYEASYAQRTMLEKALSDHDNILDSWIAPEGVEVIEVVGIGLNTVYQFKYEQFMERKCLLCAHEPIYKPVPQFSLYGDETVMGYSAEAYEGEKKVWYVDLGTLENEKNPEAVEHADFGNNKSIQILIRNILTNESSTTPFIYTERPTFSGTTYTILSTHSPVSLEVVDLNGRRVGAGTSIPQTDIPGSAYMELAGSTYIIIPQGIEYDVSIKGTGYGSMTFVTESLTGDAQTRVSSAEIATITPSTTIALSVAENTFSNLVIDTNGDTVVDQELTPQGEVVIPKGTYLALRNAIKSLPIHYRYKQHILALINLAEHFDKKSLTRKRFAKLESRILTRIEQTLKYAVKKRQLTQAQITPVLKIITSLK